MKPTDLKCYKQVAAVIGEAYADHELQRVIDFTRFDMKTYFNFGFNIDDTPQRYEFWNHIRKGENPYEHGHEKPELKEWIYHEGEWLCRDNDYYTDDHGCCTMHVSEANGVPVHIGEDKPYLSEITPTNSDKERSDVSTNKYKVLCKGVEIDVYDVLMAYGVTNPADQHAIKKMLMPGKRGVKDANQDRREAIQSLERAIELAQSDK